MSVDGARKAVECKSDDDNCSATLTPGTRRIQVVCHPSQSPCAEKLVQVELVLAVKPGASYQLESELDEKPPGVKLRSGWYRRPCIVVFDHGRKVVSEMRR